MFFFALSLCLFGSAFAQIPSLGSCPEVQTQPGFDLSKYTGRWYETHRYFTILEVGNKCFTVDCDLDNNGTLKIVNSRVSVVTGKVWSINAVARVPDQANPAKLKVKLAVDPIGIERDYWVLGTDYENYAVVYSCRDIKLLKYQVASILTRERDPPQEVIDEAMEVATQNKLHKSKFVTTNQTDC